MEQAIAQIEQDIEFCFQRKSSVISKSDGRVFVTDYSEVACKEVFSCFKVANPSQDLNTAQSPAAVLCDLKKLCQKSIAEPFSEDNRPVYAEKMHLPCSSIENTNGLYKLRYIDDRSRPITRFFVRQNENYMYVSFELGKGEISLFNNEAPSKFLNIRLSSPQKGRAQYNIFKGLCERVDGFFKVLACKPAFVAEVIFEPSITFGEEIFKHMLEGGDPESFVSAVEEEAESNRAIAALLKNGLVMAAYEKLGPYVVGRN